jgi:hypothetical protein
MRKQNRPDLPASAHEIHDRIEHWRQTRQKRTHMPADLWAAAVGLAREHGIYSVAHALELSYGALKNHVARAGENEPVAETPANGFVELPPPQIGTPEQMAGELEFTAADGAKLTMRLPRIGAIDILGLAQAFWRRGA